MYNGGMLNNNNNKENKMKFNEYLKMINNLDNEAKKDIDMSQSVSQLDKLAMRVNGDDTITSELVNIVAKHNIRQATDVCWAWTNEHGKDTCGGIGALAEFINNDCKTIRWVSQRNHVRLAVDGTPVWTTSNGG